MASTLETETKIDVYELDGDECVNRPTISVKNHWNIGDFVIIRVGKKEYTVEADALERAIHNARGD